jgi:hypothetical protein
MNYKFKGTSISSITSSGNTTNQNYYQQFPTTSTNYNGLRPLNLSYSLPNGDISNICTATSTTYNYTQNISPPSGANYFRAICVGGGGGGGGNGGTAILYVPFYGEGTCGGRSGGSGGSGGKYYYDSTYLVNISNANLTVVVGNGGNAGNRGANATEEKLSANDLSLTASRGNSGNSGNVSYIQISNTRYATANGGGGGNGGDGGEVLFNIPHQFNCSGSPSNGNTGNGGSGGNNTNLNFPSLNAGNGGGATFSGSSGQVQIIWLFN